MVLEHGTHASRVSLRKVAICLPLRGLLGIQVGETDLVLVALLVVLDMRGCHRPVWTDLVKVLILRAGRFQD